MKVPTWMGPWPLRPLWQFILIATVQYYGVNESIVVRSLPDSIAAGDLTVWGGGLTRLGLSVSLSVLVVAVQWGFYRLTTLRRSTQPFAMYFAMIVIGALVAVGFLAGLAIIGGDGVPVSLFAGMLLHYMALIAIVQTSIGVIGSQMSASAARAEDALAKLSTQERRFVASEERARRIAAEFLHDRVQADLLVIAIELRRVGESAPPEIASQIASITEVVESVRVSEVRDTSRMLSPLVQSTGLSSALATLAQRWRDAMQVSLDVDPGIDALTQRESANSDLAVGTYRIIEQALLNAAAHGHARQVQVSVLQSARDGIEGIRVHIGDDGEGFEPAEALDGGGFAISQVWARLLGGDWQVRSSAGQGTSVTAWLPIAATMTPSQP